MGYSDIDDISCAEIPQDKPVLLGDDLFNSKKKKKVLIGKN